ncbi:MAG TPA: hypothetical protein VGI58_18695 [Streptosporangiaceae bacterium]|jgi:hypothetical protein
MIAIRTLAAVLVAGLVPAVAIAWPADPVTGWPPRHPAGTGTGTIATSAFRLSDRKHYGQPANGSGYSEILTTGRAREAWIFGGTNPGGPSSPVAGQWNGSAFVATPLPPGLGGFITDAVAVSADDIWAASQYGQYVVHWNGHRWSVVRRWTTGQITGLTALSARNVWVFGATEGGTQGAGTWHFNGTTWTRYTGAASTIYRASAMSSADIWAIFATPVAQSVRWYHQGRWQSVPAGRALAKVQLHDILALSDRDVWVLGAQTSRPGVSSMVLARWNGRAWWRVPISLHAWPGQLAPGIHGGVLVTATPGGAMAAGLILTVSPRGVQTVTRIQSAQGSGVSDAALIPGARGIWAIGGILTAQGSDAALWTGQLPRTRRSATDDDE